MKDRWIKLGSLLLILAILAAGFAGCASSDESMSTGTIQEEAQTPEVTTAEDSVQADANNPDAAAESAKDMEDLTAQVEWDETVWDGSGTALALEGESVEITQAGTYVLEGSYSGQIVVNTEDDGLVRLVLNGVALSNSEDAPLYVKDADQVVLTLAEGTTNTITDTSAHWETAEGEEYGNGAITSKSDLIVEGEGTLTIVANEKSGILAKDALLIQGGNIEVTTARNGIKANDLIWLTGGRLAIEAGTDGLESEQNILLAGGELTIESGDDTIHAEGDTVVNDGVITLVSGDDGIHSDETVTVNGGTLSILECYEGLESMSIVINGGDISIIASDDGINVADTSDTASADGFGMKAPGGMEAVLAGDGLIINGGNIYINSGGDGLDSNGNAWMTGGTVVVDGPTNSGNGSLDYNGTFPVDGGTLIAAGSIGMAEVPSDSSAINVLAIGFEAQLAAGTEVTVENGTGEVLLAYAPSKTFQSFVFASEELLEGDTVTVLVNGEVYDQVEISDTITNIGTALGGFGGPGGRGDRMTPPNGQMPEGMERPENPKGERPGGQVPPDANTGATATE